MQRKHICLCKIFHKGEHLPIEIRTGAYEPPKEAKEHETRFHDNPNYIMIFENL